MCRNRATDETGYSLVRFRPGRFLKHQCRLVCSMTCTTPRRLNALSRAFAHDRVSKSRQTTNAKSRVPSSRTRIIDFNFRASYKKKSATVSGCARCHQLKSCDPHSSLNFFSTPCGFIVRRSRVSRILSRRATGHKQNSAALGQCAVEILIVHPVCTMKRTIRFTRRRSVVRSCQRFMCDGQTHYSGDTLPCRSWRTAARALFLVTRAFGQ